MLIGIIAISLIVSLVSVNSFEDVVVYLLEAIYQFMFVRYVYLYKEYIERKELEASKEKEKKEEKVVVEVKEDKTVKEEEKPKEVKRRGRPKKNKDEEALK